MRWLSIHWEDSKSRVAIQLPCPSADLIGLITESKDRLSVPGMLRSNPSLMLFALSKFHLQHKTAPSNHTEFAGWASDNLVRLFSNEKLTCTSRRLDKSKLAVRLGAYYRARNNQKFRRSLAKFTRSFSAGEFEAGSLKRMLKSVVGSKIRADEFKSKKIRNHTTLKNGVNFWLNSANETEFNLGALFDLASRNADYSNHFDRRLTEEKLASMKQLAYGASHEINNPLANIATRAQTMLAVEESPQKRQKLSVIYDQAIRAHEMISDMMLFAHPPALKTETVSLRLLLSKIVNELKPFLDRVPHLEFAVVIGAGIDQANLDPTQISVAIKNLIQNSVEAIQSSDQQPGRVDVRVARRSVENSDDEAIEISVWDDGQGISESVGRHLFDPFFSGREAGRGLGFGLSKVWAIAKLHGGNITLDKSGKSGTRFTLQIPTSGVNVADSHASELVISCEPPVVEEEAA
ncbi:MAG: sensor histidine kinase [Mariniblastus sp.]